MRDEFWGSSTQTDEYGNAASEHPVTKEFAHTNAPEYFTGTSHETAPAYEFPTEYPGQTDRRSASEDKDQKRRKKRHLLKKMVYLVAASVAAVSITDVAIHGTGTQGFLFFQPGISSEQPTATPTPAATNKPQPTKQPDKPEAYRIFPVLDHLPPQGDYDVSYILYYEGQFLRGSEPNMEYIKTELGDVYFPLHGTDANSMPEIEGLTYHPDTQTLTLDNYTGAYLSLNAMGNGMTIEILGDCSLGYMTVFGWNYGGSITFTGSGTLTINADSQQPVGLQLAAEMSQSCIMVTSGVTLDIYGSQAALYIDATSSKIGLYYEEPLTLYGGTASSKKQRLDEVYGEEAGFYFIDANGEPLDTSGYYTMTVLDSEKLPSLHITIR